MHLTIVVHTYWDNSIDTHSGEGIILPSTAQHTSTMLRPVSHSLSQKSSTWLGSAPY